MVKYFDNSLPRTAIYPSLGPNFWSESALDVLLDGDLTSALRRYQMAGAEFNGQSSERDAYYGKDDPAYQRTPKPATEGKMANQRELQLAQATRASIASGVPTSNISQEALNAYRKVYEPNARPTTMQSEGDRLAAMIAGDDPALSPNIPLGAAGARQIALAGGMGGGGGGGTAGGGQSNDGTWDYDENGNYVNSNWMTPQEGQGNLASMMGGGRTSQQQVQDRAQIEAAARLRDRIQQQTTPADLFGVGGGDWASAWLKAQQKDPGMFGSLVQQQMAGPQATTGLAGLFNNAGGPYGQLQSAAAYIAPSKADERARKYEADTQRAIADKKYNTSQAIAGNLARLIGSGVQPMQGLTTDYGASAMLKPTNTRRFR